MGLDEMALFGMGTKKGYSEGYKKGVEDMRNKLIDIYCLSSQGSTLTVIKDVARRLLEEIDEPK